MGALALVLIGRGGSSEPVPSQDFPVVDPPSLR